MGLAAMRVAMEIACWTAGLSPWNDSKPGCFETVSFVAADLCDCKGANLHKDGPFQARTASRETPGGWGGVINIGHVCGLVNHRKLAIFRVNDD